MAPAARLREMMEQGLVLAPGVYNALFATAVEATGFDLVVPDEVPESRLPTDIELQLIREVLDPGGLRKAEFGG